MPPRAQLIMRTPFFILAKAALLIRPWVSGVNGTCTVMKSDLVKMSSSVPGSTPMRAIFSAAMNGSKPITFILKPAARSATMRPTLPRPIDADGFVAELDADEFIAVPLAAFERGNGLRDMARQRHHEGDGMLAGGDVVAAGSVHDDDASFGRRVGVDVFVADAGTADHF